MNKVLKIMSKIFIALFFLALDVFLLVKYDQKELFFAITIVLFIFIFKKLFSFFNYDQTKISKEELLKRIKINSLSFIFFLLIIIIISFGNIGLTKNLFESSGKSFVLRFFALALIYIWGIFSFASLISTISDYSTRLKYPQGKPQKIIPQRTIKITPKKEILKTIKIAGIFFMSLFIFLLFTDNPSKINIIGLIKIPLDWFVVTVFAEIISFFVILFNTLAYAVRKKKDREKDK